MVYFVFEREIERKGKGIEKENKRESIVSSIVQLGGLFVELQ